MKRPKHPLLIIAFVLAAILSLYMAINTIISSIEAPIRPYITAFLILAIVAFWFLIGRRKQRE